MHTRHAIMIAATAGSAALLAAGAMLNAQTPDLPLVDAVAVDGGSCASGIALRGTATVMSCYCASTDGSGSVWGTGTYTDDSSICAAARHAGVLGAGEGGVVTVQGAAGRSSYQGTTRNGVSSGNYGSWGGSFRFVRTAASTSVTAAASSAAASAWDAGSCSSATQWRGQSGLIACTCPGGITNNASAWGTDLYTDDSNICKAAVHAGVITRAGGRVVIEMAPGRSSYSGSTRRGMTTNNYGSWGGSFRFVN